MNKVPWAPLFTIERSGQPEIVVSGIVSVVAGGTSSKGTEQLLAVGDVNYRLWSRSLLKPWQLLSNLIPLRKGYANLTNRHFALITASHSAESEHLYVLRELLDIGKIGEEMLKCPASMPLSAEQRLKFRQDGVSQRPLFHNCSGKHLGYLLALKAQNGTLESYLEPEGKHFVPLRNVLGALLKRPASSFQVTTDGCRIPNYAMSSYEMAELYLSLVNFERLEFPSDSAKALEPMLSCYGDLQKIMVTYPELVGGSGRMDTNIMLGKTTPFNFDGQPVAKQGAEGLLGISIPANPAYPSGLGILVKLASGYVERHMDLVTQELFKQLKLVAEQPGKPDDSQPHIKTIFHFQLGQL